MTGGVSSTPKFQRLAADVSTVSWIPPLASGVRAETQGSGVAVAIAPVQFGTATPSRKIRTVAAVWLEGISDGSNWNTRVSGLVIVAAGAVIVTSSPKNA